MFDFRSFLPFQLQPSNGDSETLQLKVLIETNGRQSIENEPCVERPPMWPKMRNNGHCFPLFSANNEGNAMIRQHFSFISMGYLPTKLMKWPIIRVFFMALFTFYNNFLKIH